MSARARALRGVGQEGDYGDWASKPNQRQNTPPYTHLVVLEVAEDLARRVDPVHSEKADRLRNVLRLTTVCGTKQTTSYA